MPTVAGDCVPVGRQARTAELRSPSSAASVVARERLASLDVFRGLTIAAMILVNNPGNNTPYGPLEHSKWNGLTPTDLIFPCFLFIVGISLVYSLRSRLESGAKKTVLLSRAFRRSGILFAIGLLLNAYPLFDLKALRIPGILQRIALVYLVAAVLALWLSRRGRIPAVVGILVGYWILLRFVSVPGFGIPGRDVAFLDPDANLAAWLDRKLMPGHLFEGTHDPMGLLSTLPAIATTLCGTLTGEWLRSSHTPRRKAAWMLGLGIVGLAAGRFFSIWLPLNRKLWTSSYVLFTAGFSLLCLALCYWATDIKRWRGSWTGIFSVFGTNAIATYAFAEFARATLENFLTQTDGQIVTWREFIFGHLFAQIGSPAFASLIYSIVFMLVCLFLIWLLYRKQVFIKI